MELLTRTRCALLLAALAIAVTSCLVAEPAETPSRFSHAVHAGEQLTCAFCHGGPGEVHLPGPQLCQPCHEQRGIGDVKLGELFDVSGRWTGGRVAALPDGVVFTHAAHTGQDCATCHGAIAQSGGIPRPSIRKRDCMECHAREAPQTSCESCHPGIGPSWVPPTHDSSWAEHHGLAVRARSDASADRCELCHVAEESCAACHREQMPRDHTNHWRVRGHGISVRIDRTRCDACHRTDFCTACHETTRPRTHSAGFGSPQNRHCTTCHLPLRDNGCATCHKTAIAHEMATPLPPGHHPAMNCRQCHGAGVALPHPDNGTSCIACHR